MPHFLKPEDGLFRGPEDFLKRRKELSVGQLIRNYNYGRSAGEEEYYVIGLEGKLYNARTQEEVQPTVLSEGNGWCYEGLGLDNLPDDIIKAFLGI
jgi:hypothetical protein